MKIQCTWGPCTSSEDTSLCLVHGIRRKLGRAYKQLPSGWVVLACSLEDRIRHVTENPERFGSPGFRPHYPKVYHWPVVTRLLAKPLSPPSSFSYFGNRTMAACPVPPFVTRRSQRGRAHGQPWLLGLGPQHTHHQGAG